jgi:hypothetical protein
MTAKMRLINFLKNYSKGPSLILFPSTSSPSQVFVRNFKIDGKTMEAVLKSIDAQSPTNKSISLNISVCKMTNEAFDTLINTGNFSIIKSLTLIGNLPTNTPPNSTGSGALLQQLLTTPVNLQLLFKTKLESLTLKNWNLTDEFLDNCVPIIQLNNHLQYLNLDFNDFKRRDHIDKILRVNRKLINISVRSGKNLVEKIEKFNEPLPVTPVLAENAEVEGQKSDAVFEEVQSTKPDSGKKSTKTSTKSATPSANENNKTNAKDENSTPNPTIPEPEMLIMTAEEVREYRRAKLYKKEVDENNTVPMVFLSDKIERRDKKLFFPGNGVFKRLIF